MAVDNTRAVLRLHSALARVMSDARFNDGRPHGAELRQFIIGYHWAHFEGGDKDATWARTKELGLPWSREPRMQGYKLRELYRTDAPRYEPPNLYCHASPCPIILTRGPRTGEPCGKNGTYSFRVADPVTGEWEINGWCRAHQEHANAAREVERRKTNIPKPLPNTGGLLPCYIRATNWPDIYRAASPSWEPPAIGIRADDWPVLAKVHEQQQQRPQFVALDGGAEGPGEGAVPDLRLVTA